MATINAISNKTGTLTVDNALTVTAGGATITAGDTTISAGNLTLPTTTTAGDQGIIKIGGVNAIQTYGTNNLFVGPVGNTTLTTATAIQNTIINGVAVGASITTANRNLIAGYNAGNALTEGFQNVLLSGGGLLTTGSYNTFVGLAAGSRPTTGSFNTMIGYGSGTSNTTVDQTSNIYLKSPGVAGESHVMRLGADGTGDGQVDTTVIAGTNATISGAATAGTVNLATGAGAKIVTLGSTNDASSLALKYGTADFSLASATGTVMTALDTGEITYPLQSAFSALNSTLRTNVTGDGSAYTVIFNTELFDQNDDFDGTSTFTAPVTGRYFFTSCVFLDGMTSSFSSWIIWFETSNRPWNVMYANPGPIINGDNISFPCTAFVDMDAADTIVVKTIVGGSTKTVDIFGPDSTNPYTFFSGYLVC